jgi:2OG-Fe(II) oxygenase superfamily
MSANVAPLSIIDRVDGSVRTHSGAYAKEFLSAEPFKHVAIDGFFEVSFAEALLANFPAFNPALAKNEIYGGVWGKAVNENIRTIGPVYQDLYELVASREFLDLIGDITGIPDLLIDPKYYGGGTHENLHGQDLAAHVDFNYDEAEKLHRRLNLIVYLNKDWRPEWGGALEIHSNPRNHEEDRVQAYNPTFNRAILFETNEYSWHGFPKIDLPPSERHRSRKSISIYLYTRERPANEIAPPHGTFYVHRPLENRFQPGYTLTEADVKHLRFEMDRRDKWIELYQKMELAKNGEIAEKAGYIADILSRVRAPLTGYVLQEGPSEGLYSEGWTAQKSRFMVRPLEPLKSLTIKGWRPDAADPNSKVAVSINGEPRATVPVGHGVFEIPITFDPPSTVAISVEISCDPVYRPERDNRELGFVLMEVRAEH